MDSTLFENMKISGLDLKNCFLMSAAAGWKATADCDTADCQDQVKYRVAPGGPALIIGGGVSIHSSARSSPDSSLFDDDRRIPSYKGFADQIHAGGSAASFQPARAAHYSFDVAQPPMLR